MNANKCVCFIFLVFDAADSTTEIGQLNISIEALEVLTKLKESIPS